jgi:hypothetical protein
MNVISVKALIAGLTIALTGFACADERPEASATSPPASASACPTEDLQPRYLPSDVRRVERESLVGQPEHTTTWTKNDLLIQIVGGISADRGDDPEARSIKVRGFDGQIGPLPLAEQTYLVADWTEEEDCGFHQYAVIGRGIDEQELLRVADSLEGGGPAVTDRN